MKVPVVLLVSALALCLAAPVAAQGTEDEVAVQTCARLTSTTPLDGVAAAELAQLLLEGEVLVEMLDGDACVSPAAEPNEPIPQARAGTPYVDFVARGAGAAITVAALAERHEDAQTLDDLDRAAKDLHAWAKSQRKWLDSHPALTCYGDAHAQWRAGVVDVREGAKAVRKAIKQLRAAPMERAVRKLSAGARKLTTVDFDEVTQACAEEAS